MKNNVVISCAVTGSGDSLDKHPDIPVTPQQIADAAISAAKAGAAIVHIHVRDPETGKGGRELRWYKEVVERVRADPKDVIINCTAGMGGDWVPSDDNPAEPGPGSDMVGWVLQSAWFMLKHCVRTSVVLIMAP